MLEAAPFWEDEGEAPSEVLEPVELPESAPEPEPEPEPELELSLPVVVPF